MALPRGRNIPRTPGDISDLTAEAISDTEIQLSFSASSNASYYERRLDAGAAVVLDENFIVGTNDPLEPSTEYDIEVRGVRGGPIYGNWSNVATATTEAGSGAPVVANQTMEFGRLTLADHGKCPLVATGAEITSIELGTRTQGSDHFTTSTHYVKPTAQPSDATYVWEGCTATNAFGTSDPFDLTITTEADVYSIDHGELSAVINVGNGIDGKTIKGRPGADIIGEAAGSRLIIASTRNYPTGLTITSHDTEDQCFIRRLEIRHAGLITFNDLKIRDQFRDGIDGNGNNALIEWGTNTNGPQVTFNRCELYNIDLAEDQTFVHSSGNNAVVTNNSPVTGDSYVDISASDDPAPPDLSDLNINGTTNAKIKLNLLTTSATGFRILEVDNVTKILRVRGNPVQGAGIWRIGDISMLKIFKGSATVAGAGSLICNDCNFHDYHTACGGYFGPHVHIENCDFFDSTNDHFSFAPSGQETHFKIIRNRFGSPWGSGYDPQNPHCDCIQLQAHLMTQSNTEPYEFIGNVLLVKGTRSELGAQFLFLRGNFPSADIRVTAKLEHNLCLTKVRNGLTLRQTSADTIVRGNTLLYDQRPNVTEDGELTPWINVEDSEDSGLTVEYNVYGNLNNFGSSAWTAAGNTPGTINLHSRNHSFGPDDTDQTNADQAALFAGASFNSDDIADITALIAAATPDASPLVETGQVVVGAYSGYYDYTTGDSDAPWDEAGHDISGDFNDVTGATVSTATTSNEVTLSGVSATGALVRVSGGDATFRVRDGSNNLIRDYSSDEYVVPNGYKITIRRTSSGSGATAVNTTVTVGATSDTWTITTA